MPKSSASESIDFSKPMQVIRIGEKLRKPYHKKPFLYIDKSTLGSKNAFLEFIKGESRAWDTGTYILKAAKVGEPIQGTTLFFAQFDMERGKLQNFLKASPSSGSTFVCWDFFDGKGPGATVRGKR